MKKKIILFLLVCIIWTSLFITGVVFFLTDHEPGDKCEMTYMFEYPQYVRISQEIDSKYPKYGLYAYGEGRTTKKARNMYFDGIPVLFIPGNAGSHHQVRSLSSVALRKAINSGTSYHFDYFTIDLNSEFSALYGPVLFDQLDYAVHSIYRILELYRESPSSPKQVVLIGHSVGGVVARKVIANLLKHDKQLVSILITLASPLTRGPIYFDRYGSNFYASSFYQQNDITSVSISGGYSDILVPSYLTVNEGNGSINLVATNIAKSWVESNHVQILWCKQIVLAINRALFDIVDRKTRQISTDPQFVRQLFEHHLIHNSGTQLHITGDTTKLVKMGYKGEWIENIARQYTVDLPKGVRQPHWYMVAITTQHTYEMLTILAINLEVTDWAFVCSAAYPNKASRVCIEGEHLSQYSEIASTSRQKRRLLTVNMHSIRKRNKEYTHVVFRVLPTSEPVTFHVDTYGAYERAAIVQFPVFGLHKQVVVEQTPDKALIYNLVFPELRDPLQIYQLYVEPIQCSSNTHHATASLIVPWANENVHSYFTEILNKPFNVRIQNAKPIEADYARVRLILEPSCTYKISIRLNLLGFFGQIARYYSTFLISTLAVVFLLAFQSQIHHLGQNKTVPIFFSSLITGLKQFWIVKVTFVLSVTLRNFIPRPEYRIFSSSVYLGVAMSVLFMVSYVVVFILVAAYCISLFTLESTVHKLTLKLLAKSVTLTIRFSDYFMSFLQKLPLLVAAGLLVLCFSTCGGLALCVGLVFYFLKLTQMSQEYVEQVAWLVLGNITKYIRKAVCKSNKNEPQATKEGTSALANNSNKSPKETIRLDENIGSIPSGSRSNIEETIKETINVEGADHKAATATEIHTITQSAEPINENQEQPKESNLTTTNNAIFFHSSIFFMWMFVTILNIPAVLTWAHNFKFSRHLSPDESLIPGLVFSVGAFFLWQFELPRTDRKYTCLLRLIILCLIPISLLYTAVSVYRLNYMFTFLFALVLLQQSLAPKLETVDDRSTETVEDKEERTYENVKMKMD